MSKTVVALALLESVQAFQAPMMRSSPVQMFSEGDIGVLPPLGVYDPLGLIEKRDMRRYEIMEIKHGRAAMLGFLHVLVIESGLRFPTSECAAAPAGLVASFESMPTAAWLQIMVTTCMMEYGTFLFDAQTEEAEVGDIGGDAWVRYDDPEAKTFKLNVERQNGRAAMLGIMAVLSEAKGLVVPPLDYNDGFPKYSGDIMVPFEGQFHVNEALGAWTEAVLAR